MIALHPALRRLRYIVVFDDDPDPVRGKFVADDAHALASRLFHAPAACPYAPLAFSCFKEWSALLFFL